MSVKRATNQANFILSNTNDHLLDIYNSDYYLELGVIDIQKIQKLLNGKLINLNELIYQDLAVNGTGKITDDYTKDIFFQINYLTSLRQKCSSDHFFITCSVICYQDNHGVEKHAPLILIPIDLDYDNYKVIISGQPIVNGLLINHLNNELEKKSSTLYQIKNAIFQRKFTSVESIDHFTKEIAQKYHKNFSIDNFLTIGKVRLTAGQNDSEFFDILHSLYDKESTPNVLIKKYFNEVNAVLPTNIEQKYALLNASNGKSFIVNGKLGSGKSYTAINMIVDALSKNKKILYVNQDIDNLFEIKKNLAVLKLDVYTYNFAKNIKTVKIPPLSFPNYENPNFDFNKEYASEYGPLINIPKGPFKKKITIDNHEDDIDKLEKFARGYSIKRKKVTTPDNKTTYKRFFGTSKKDIYEKLAVLKHENPNLRLIHIEKDLEYHEVLQNAKGLEEVEKRLMKNINPSYEINCWLNLSVIHNNISPDEITKRTINLYNINKKLTQKVKDFATNYHLNIPHNLTDLYNLIGDIYLFKKTPPQKNWLDQKKRNFLITAWHDIEDNQNFYKSLTEQYHQIIKTKEIINIEEILKQIYQDAFINPEENISQNEVFINRLLTETEKINKIVEESNRLITKILTEYHEICLELDVDYFNDEMFTALNKLADYLKENHLQKKIFVQYENNNNFLEELQYKVSNIKHDIDNAKKNFRQFLEKGIKDDFKQASSIFNSTNSQKELNKIFNFSKVRQANLRPDDVKKSYQYFYEKQQLLNQELVDNTKVNEYSVENQYDSFIEFVNLITNSTKKEEKFIKTFYEKFIDDDKKIKQMSNLIVTFIKDVNKISNIETKLYHYNINISGNNYIERTENLKKWHDYLLNINDIKKYLEEIFIEQKNINYHTLIQIKQNVKKLEEIENYFKKNNKRFIELFGESYKGVNTDINTLKILFERFDEFYDRFKNHDDINQLFDEQTFENIFNDSVELNNLYGNWVDKFRLFSICFSRGQAILQRQNFDQNEKTLDEFYYSTNQIKDIIFVSDWINRFKKYGLNTLANGIKSGEYKVNLSSSYLYSSLLNYRDIVEEYQENNFTTQQFLEKLDEYNSFERDYCTKNILKMQMDAKKEREIKDKIITKRINNIDFNDYNQYLKLINRPRFVCLSDLSAFDSEIDLNKFDLVIIDDAHLVDTTLTRKLDKIKQVVVFGDRTFRTSVTSNFMIFIQNTLIQKNRSSMINFPLRYLQMTADFANEFTVNNQYIISRKREKTVIEKIKNVNEFSEQIFQTYKNNPDYLINVVVGQDHTRRDVYSYLVKRLIEFYSEEEIHIILNYKIKIINAIFESGSYSDIVYFYYTDIERRDDRALILRNFSTTRHAIYVMHKEKNIETETEEIQKEIEQLMDKRKYTQLSSPIVDILIKDLRQQKNDKLRIMQGYGSFDIIIKSMINKTDSTNVKMLGIIIKGKENELIYSNINTYNYYVTTYKNFGWDVMVIDIESLVDDYQNVIKQINEKCEQLRR